MVANVALQTWASEFCSDRQAFAERHRKQFGDEATDDEIEQFRQEMIKRRLSSKEDVILGCPLCNSVQLPKPSNGQQPRQ